MIRAACHCGAVKFGIAEPPAWVLECNCSICRRHGAMWAYYFGEDQEKLLRRPDPESSEPYLWGDKMIGLHHCRTCPCVTHAQGLGEASGFFAVNARMMVGLDPKTVEIRQVDNGRTGFFWTTSASPPRESNHPPMPPDEWR